MANLKKPRTERKCVTCEFTYVDDEERCKRCDRNPKSNDNWAPNTELSATIVLDYLKQQPHISTVEIAKHYEVSEISINAGMKQLLRDGKVSVTQTVSIVEKKKK